MNKKRKDTVVNPDTLKLTARVNPVAIRAERKSQERVRNKPVLEQKEYSDSVRETIISKQRTIDETKVYHEGKRLQDGKWVYHKKHLKNTKKHKNG